MKCPLIANYHSHTKRCGHASGEDEEYADAAYQVGLEELGFSDHVIFPDASQKGMRGDPSMLPGYLSSVRALQKEYEGRMKIHLGFECEYLPQYLPYYRSLLEKGDVDYLILGQHMTSKNGKFTWYADLPSQEQAIREYAEAVVAGIESGLFLYVAHPDVIIHYIHRFDAPMQEAAYAIALAAKKAHVPLEVNMGYLNWKGRECILSLPPDHYPYGPFWDIVSEVGCDVVIGLDAHSPDIYFRGDYAFAVRFCEEHRLHRLERLDIPARKKN